MKIINIRNIVFIVFFAIMKYNVKAQNTTLKVGDNPMIKEPSAIVEFESINRGVLLPSVKLTSTNLANPVNAPVNALTVFNTNTIGDVTPGYYYWNATINKWIKLAEDNIWKLEGNALTGTEFLGSTNDEDVVFKRNNIQSGLLEEVNTAFGFAAFTSNYNGYQNTAIGDRALLATSTGKYNTGIGSCAMIGNNYGSYNTAVGVNSLAGEGLVDYNTAIGYMAGEGKFGNNNTFIGSFTHTGNNIGSVIENATAIGYSASVSQSNSLVLGGLNQYAVNVGIGITAPTHTLDVNGTLKVRKLPSGTSTDQLVVIDNEGVIKKVANTNIAASTLQNYSYKEQETGRLWVNGSKILWKTIGISNTIVGNDVFDLSGFFEPFELGEVISVKVINTNTNSISTSLMRYDKETNKMYMGTGMIMPIPHDIGIYHIIIEYIKAVGTDVSPLPE